MKPTTERPVSVAPWLTERGIDLTRVPIDSILQQAVSPDDDKFRSGCSLLRAMSHAGRVEAGVFLLGLLRYHPDDYARLTVIAEALASFPVVATVDALSSELRRVKGSSSTRRYLRRIIDTLELFPARLVEEQVQSLSTDPQIGVRIRQHLRAMTLRYPDV